MDSTTACRLVADTLARLDGVQLPPHSRRIVDRVRADLAIEASRSSAEASGRRPSSTKRAHTKLERLTADLSDTLGLSSIDDLDFGVPITPALTGRTLIEQMQALICAVCGTKWVKGKNRIQGPVDADTARRRWRAARDCALSIAQGPPRKHRLNWTHVLDQMKKAVVAHINGTPTLSPGGSITPDSPEQHIPSSAPESEPEPDDAKPPAPQPRRKARSRSAVVDEEIASPPRKRSRAASVQASSSATEDGSEDDAYAAAGVEAAQAGAKPESSRRPPARPVMPFAWLFDTEEDGMAVTASSEGPSGHSTRSPPAAASTANKDEEAHHRAVLDLILRQFLFHLVIAAVCEGDPLVTTGAPADPDVDLVTPPAGLPPSRQVQHFTDSLSPFELACKAHEFFSEELPRRPADARSLPPVDFFLSPKASSRLSMLMTIFISHLCDGDREETPASYSRWDPWKIPARWYGQEPSPAPPSP